MRRSVAGSSSSGWMRAESPPDSSSPGTCSASPPIATFPIASWASSPTPTLVMQGTFWLGVYPGITDAMVDYIVDNLREFCAQTLDGIAL